MRGRTGLLFIVTAALVLLLTVAAPGAADATHISKPVITTERLEYPVGELVTIEGWVDYNNEPAPEVLLDIMVRTADGNETIDRSFVRSDSDGNFQYEPKLPDVPATYDINIISNCRDEHRDICTFQSSSIAITLVGQETPEVPDSDDDSKGDGERQDVIVLRETMGETDVVISWTPDDIGKENIFDIRFVDESGAEMQTQYNFSLLEQDAPVEGSQRVNQAPGEQRYVFDRPGQYTLRIEHPDGVTDMPIAVTPEFPLVALVMGISLILVLAVGATRGNLAVLYKIGKR